MELLLEPFVQSSLADQVLRFNFGFDRPDRKRSKILRDRKISLGKQLRRGSGTESTLASIVLPLIIADADRLESLTVHFMKYLLLQKLNAVIDRYPEEPTKQEKEAISRRFTEALEKLSKQLPALSVDKGRVVRVDGPWSMIAVGDPRTDSYHLERISSASLEASELASTGQQFVRVLIHEANRMPRPVYLPAWQPDSGPSSALFEMLLRAKPATALSDSDKRFSNKR